MTKLEKGPSLNLCDANVEELGKAITTSECEQLERDDLALSVFFMYLYMCFYEKCTDRLYCCLAVPSEMLVV